MLWVTIPGWVLPPSSLSMNTLPTEHLLLATPHHLMLMSELQLSQLPTMPQLSQLSITPQLLFTMLLLLLLLPLLLILSEDADRTHPTIMLLSPQL